MFGAFPLDMSQYKSLFGGSRIPQKQKDWLYHCGDSKHFIVLRGGQIYAVDLFDKDGTIAPSEQIHACLSTILGEQSSCESENCVGSLTSLGRDQWAEARSELFAIGQNAVNLTLIDSALFAVCLDTEKSDDPRRLVQGLLVGDDASNRWFDKCFQLIVDANGMATINFEHSWGDGVAVLRLMEESFRDANRNHFVEPKQLFFADFTLSESLRQKIKDAQEKHIAVGSRLRIGTAEYFGMNRKFIKRSKLSPDSIMQLAVQLAFYKLFNEFVPTYESCSTAAFLKGRTECVRSATCATRDAVLAVENGQGDLAELLKKCSAVHSQMIKEAATELFNSDVYQYMNRFVISTSTLATETVVLGGFGPVVSDGFGIAYNVVPAKMGAVILSYNGQRDATIFADALLESLDILKNTIEKKLLI
ncbi:unnamed protein product [Gongylonema pulchrum]|uniref:Carnitine O-palmitoyltransferase 2, mitochondrial n=1 Tax=Gongylonema pulchrum TaxID=637853 RepID=A0A183E5X7_9BILA|nr:unnamed protein product [Gongylonema pulchrum]